MDSRGILFVVALIASLSATELVRVLALRLGAMDRPGGRRVHQKPTARLGGLGIFWGFAMAMLLAVYVFHAVHTTGRAPFGFAAVIGGAGLMLLTGLMDDVHGMAPPSKLLLQALAAVLVYFAGWRVETLGIPGLGEIAVGPFALPLTVGWIVLVTNALNLIDGLDGLACGVAIIAAFALAAVLGPQLHASGTMAFALAGALVGFLWFNLHPALIFMGDAGSLFVGFLLATISLRTGPLVGHGAFPLVPMLLLAVPLFDTGSAVARRLAAAWRAGRTLRGFAREARARVMTADRAHVHHRLLDAGCSTRRASALLWGAAVAFAWAAWLVCRAPLAGLVAAGALGGVFGLALARLAPARHAFERASRTTRSSAAGPAASPDATTLFPEAEALALEAEQQAA